MNKSNVINIIFVVFLVTSVLAGCAYSPNPTLNRKPMPAPDLVLEDVFGHAFRLDSFRGRVVVLNFWASSCPPCIIEMPEFQAIQEKMRDRIGMASITYQDSAAFVRDFVVKRGYTWQFISDTSGASVIAYGITNYPTTVFIDTQGRLALTQIGGPLNQAFLASVINQIFSLK
jgi:thiol-disulfide isomerase/thioredoxin